MMTVSVGGRGGGDKGDDDDDDDRGGDLVFSSIAHTDSFICTQSNGFKYSYASLTV